MTTLVYLHGFNSSPGGVKGRMIAAACADLPRPPRVYMPQLPHRPSIAIRDICAWVDAHAPGARDTTFVGSSLGGFYALVLAERYGTQAVAINPAVRPFDALAAATGPQRNPYTGEDYVLGNEHFDDLRALHVERITRPERYFLLMRSGDELLDWREAVEYFAGAWQYVAGGGNHGWEDFGAEVPSVLRFAGCAGAATP